MALRGIEFSLPDAFVDKEEYDRRQAGKKEWERSNKTFEEFQSELDSREAVLDLQNARLKKPERITFHTVRLRPNWFVNTDPRQMVFTAVNWENADQIETSVSGLENEISQLKQRGFQNPQAPFIKALNGLAENAEANRRSEDADKFKKMAVGLDQRQCHIHDSLRESRRDSLRNKICSGLPVVNKHEDKYYCLFHLPTNSKNVSAFEKLLEDRLKSTEEKVAAVNGLPDGEKRRAGVRAIFDFRFFWFPYKVDLSGREFKTKAKFESSTFSSGANFISCEFEQKASFRNCTFQGDSFFVSSTFHRDADFYNCRFEADSWTNFKGAKFKSKIGFDYATFMGNVKFSSDEQGKVFDYVDTWLSLDTEFINTGVISFHSVRLRPGWFINCDATTIDFTNIDWGTGFGSSDYIKKEIEDIKAHKGDIHAEHLFGIANRRLGNNAETNSRYDEASKLRRMAMEADRLERIAKRRGWKQELHHIFSKETKCSEVLNSGKPIADEAIKHLRKAPYSPISFLYRWTSGFGESWGWAFLMLILITTLPAFYYTSPHASFERDVQVAESSQRQAQTKAKEKIDGLEFGDAVTYSLATSAFMRPDPKPSHWSTKIFVFFHSIFAPLQAALLALAIRRKFMR